MESFTLLIDDYHMVEDEQVHKGLAFLSISNKVDRTAYFHSFSGNHRHIFDYLIDEVLSQQPEDIQSFLMRTSMLHSFCPALAEAVLLEPAQLFLVPLDDTRTWYRYHHLFAEALLTKFHSKEHEQTRMELHRRAAAWYENHGMIIDAIHHLLQAWEYETAALCMAKYFTVIIELGEEAALLRWLESMPMTYRISHPDLFLFSSGNHGDLRATGAGEAISTASRSVYVRSCGTASRPASDYSYENGTISGISCLLPRGY